MRFFARIKQELRLKASLKFGALALVPFGLAYFLVRNIAENFAFWEALFELLGIERYHYSVVSALLTAVLAYLVGRFIISRMFTAIAKKNSRLKRLDGYIKAKVASEEERAGDRKLMQGLKEGRYKMVLYKEYGKLWQVGFWVKNIRVPLADGDQILAHIQKRPPKFADWLWAELEDVQLFANPEDVADVIETTIVGGYFVSYDKLKGPLVKLSELTPDEYEEIVASIAKRLDGAND